MKEKRIFKVAILNTKWRQQIPQKFVYEQFYVYEIAAVNLSKIYSLENAKKKCKPNNCDLNRDWTSIKNGNFHGNKSFFFWLWFLFTPFQVVAFLCPPENILKFSWGIES